MKLDSADESFLVLCLTVAAGQFLADAAAHLRLKQNRIAEQFQHQYERAMKLAKEIEEHL